jgi:Uma2 family endonuclease
MENNLIKEEWLDGTVMMSPRPEHNHMKVMRTLYDAFRDYFGKKCEVALEEALFLTKDNPKELKSDFVKLKALVTAKKAELSPDIAVYCDKEQIFRRGFLGIPALIVEVLSPSNHTDDTVIKKDAYEKFAVPEYWIANPHTKQVFVYALEGLKYELKGTYNFIKDCIKSVRFEGLVIDMKDIELYEEDEFDL